MYAVNTLKLKCSTMVLCVVYQNGTLSPVYTDVATTSQLRKVIIVDRLQRSQKAFAEVGEATSPKAGRQAELFAEYL